MPRVTPPEKGDLVFEAVHELIRREGVEAASMRRIAAECGLSPSGVRHLFGNQAHLLKCSWWRLLEDIELPVRQRSYVVARRLEEVAEGPRSAQVPHFVELLLALLPVDEAAVDRARLLMAYELKAEHDPELAEQVGRWHAMRGRWCRVVTERLGIDQGDGEETPWRDRPLGPEARVLDALLRGLSAALVSGAMDREQASSTIDRHLRWVLAEGPSGGPAG